MPTDEIAIPIILCVLIILGFLTFGAVLYHFWEDWDYISAAYFCFITMTTIGFGDMVPSNSFLNFETSVYGKFWFSEKYLVRDSKYPLLLLLTQT